MSDFGVKPSALRGYADVLSGGGSKGLDMKYMIDAEDYVDKYVMLDDWDAGMIFTLLKGKVNDLGGQLKTNYSIISERLVQSESGLRASADEYAHTDHSNAVHLDKVYKPQGVASLDDGIDTDKPVGDPSSKLTEPGTDGAVPDLADQILNGAGYFSISTIVMTIIKVCGFDVQQWVKDRFVGNLHEVAKSKNAVQNLAAFDEVAARNVAEGCDSMMRSWHGHAAQGAQGYFDKFANGIEGESGVVADVAQRYDAILISIQQAADAIMTGISTVIDFAIQLAASLAAAGCLQEVPGVNVLIDIIGASRVWALINKINHVTKIWNYIYMGDQGVVAAITGLVGGLSSYDVDSELPKTGYYNASQGGPPDYHQEYHHGGVTAR